MRKLVQIAVAQGECLFAVDENGELWSGIPEATEDKRLVVNWSPVNRPKDGASLSERQLDFFDKWEREARERLKADADTRRKIVSLETEGATVSEGTRGSSQNTPDNGVENGEGSDPGFGARVIARVRRWLG